MQRRVTQNMRYTTDGTSEELSCSAGKTLLRADSPMVVVSQIAVGCVAFQCSEGHHYRCDDNAQDKVTVDQFVPPVTGLRGQERYTRNSKPSWCTQHVGNAGTYIANVGWQYMPCSVEKPFGNVLPGLTLLVNNSTKFPRGHADCPKISRFLLNCTNASIKTSLYSWSGTVTALREANLLCSGTPRVGYFTRYQKSCLLTRLYS